MSDTVQLYVLFSHHTPNPLPHLAVMKLSSHIQIQYNCTTAYVMFSSSEPSEMFYAVLFMIRRWFHFTNNFSLVFNKKK